MKVRDALVPAVGTATMEQPIADVARSIVEGEGLVAVVADGEPVGLVDGTDILRAVAMASDHLGRLTAADIMASDLETVTPDTDLDLVREHMHARDVGEVAVVDGGQLVGAVQTHSGQAISPNFEIEDAYEPLTGKDGLTASRIAQLAGFFEGFEEGMLAAHALSEESVVRLRVLAPEGD